MPAPGAGPRGVRGEPFARLPLGPLRRAVKARGISHEVLAERAGMTVVAVRKVMYNERWLTAPQGERLARALDLRPAAIWHNWVEPVPRRLFEPLPWQEFARCRNATSLFFPARGERLEAKARREEQARAVCGECPVVVPCREYARSNREYGFWGGESEEERAALGFGPAMPIGNVARIMAKARRARPSTSVPSCSRES